MILLRHVSTTWSATNAPNTVIVTGSCRGSACDDPSTPQQPPKQPPTQPTCISKAAADGISAGLGGYVAGTMASRNSDVGLITGAIAGVGGYYSSGSSHGTLAIAGGAAGFGSA